MGLITEIGWCDSTVNPLVGCDGCELHRCGDRESHCYAAALVGRYRGLPGWPATFDSPQHFEGRLEKTYRWKDLTGTERPSKPWMNGYPRIIFVCDLADPFTESVDPETWLTAELGKMMMSPHIYILLTKRARRMMEFFQRHPVPRNVWCGVSVTSAATVKRLDYLMEVPASVRFASMEPLLGPVAVKGYEWLEWAIVGAESGLKARKCEVGWVRDIRDQRSPDCAFFYKQDAAAGVKIPHPVLDGRRWTEMPRWTA